MASLQERLREFLDERHVPALSGNRTERRTEFIFFFSSRRRHTRCLSDWSSDVCSSDLKADQILRDLDPSVKVRFVDFHAEVTSEKMAMGWYLDGRVSAMADWRSMEEE